MFQIWVFFFQTGINLKSLFFLINQSIRIHRTLQRIDTVVQMRRGAFFVVAVANITNHGTDFHPLMLADIGIIFQMGIIMPRPARPLNADKFAAQSIHPDAGDHALGGAQHRRTAFGKNIHPLMLGLRCARHPKYR